ncbi:hypothetical protein Tco_0900519, partial [Tanacetum coccineum]
ELQQQESLITESAAIEACLVTKGATLEASLGHEGIALNDYTGVTESSGTESENNSSTTPFNRSEDENRSSDKDCNSSRNECNKSGNENICSNHESTSLGNDANADIGPSYDYDIVTKGQNVAVYGSKEKIILVQAHESGQVLDESNSSGNENRSSDKESSSLKGNDANANIGPSYDSDTVSEVPHDMFENVFAHGIQSHEQPESISNTYEVNENNSNIISDKPNMDPDRDRKNELEKKN